MIDRRPATRSFLTAAVVVAAAGVIAANAGRVAIGLYYDDYHFMHPWTSVERHRVWFGSWDPTGVESIFFRPLTALLFAARFDLFALNGTLMHALSLLGHGACAVLVAWILRREGLRRSVALSGAWVYAVHPLFPYSQTSWLTNQMHLAQSMVVLTAIVVWQKARETSGLWWMPIAILAVIGFLVKEDGVMLLPVLMALTALRIWTSGARPPRGWLLLGAAGAVLLAALLALRYDRLGQLGGYGRPTIDQGWANLLKGLNTSLFLWPTTRIWQAMASGLAILVLLPASFALWRGRTHLRRAIAIGWAVVCVLLAFTIAPAFRGASVYPAWAWQGIVSGVSIAVLALGAGASISARHRPALFVIGMGIAITAGFNLPFLLVSKREQYHLLALGATIASAGAAEALLQLAATRAIRTVVGTALLIATVPLVAGARHMSAEFLPCASGVLAADREARGWWIVPDEIRTWMDQKADACANRRPPVVLSDLPLISWGVYAEEREADVSYRWTSDRAVLLANRDTGALTLSFRHPAASASRPVRVLIRTAEGTDERTLESGDWTDATVTFRRGLLTWMRSAHRVDVVVEPWSVPAVEDPRSQDLRRFGVEMRVVARQADRRP